MVPTSGSMWNIRVDEPALLFLVLGRHADERRDDARRQLSRELLHVVEASGPHQWIHELGAERAHPVLERGDPSRCERPRHERTQSRMRGWIEGRSSSQRRHVVAHVFEHGAAGGAVGERIPVRRFDIGEAAERPEVVPVVPVHRRVFAESTPRGIGSSSRSRSYGSQLSVGVCIVVRSRALSSYRHGSYRHETTT